MIKKFSTFISIALLISVLAACGQTANPADSESPKPVYEKGAITDNRYENSIVGLGFDLPEAWVFASDEAIKELYGEGAEKVNDELGSEAMPNDAVYYEFFAYDETSTVPSVVLTVQDLAAHASGGLLITEEMFIKTLAEQFESLETIDYTVAESYEKNIGGIDMIILPISVDNLGLYQRNYVYRIENYLVSIATTAYSEEPLDDIETYISALNT